MDQIILDLQETSRIEVTRVEGDLRLSGWDQPQLMAEADEQTLSVQAGDGGCTVQAQSDCTLRVPRLAVVTIRQVGGDARAKSLDALLTIESVGGDLLLRQVGPAEIGRVGGDVSAKKIGGSLRLGNAGGDVSARSVEGSLHAGQVGGDLYARDVSGGVAAQTGGDAIVNLAATPPEPVFIRAGGDVIVRLAPGVTGRFAISAPGDIDIAVPDATVEGSGPTRRVSIGAAAEDAPESTLSAGGDVTLAGLAADPDAMGDFGERFGDDMGVMAEEFAAQIETQIESQMADFERTISERLAGLNAVVGVGGAKAEALASRARRAAERVEEVARRKADSAQRRAEAAQRRAEAATHRAEAAQRRSDVRRGHWASAFARVPPPVPPRPPMPPAPPAEPVSEAERMLILQMLEQGKINVAEAEKLLAALEKR
jgi:hypothetical protein